jgi:uncharacterized protein (UPF0335 family)
VSWNDLEASEGSMSVTSNDVILERLARLEQENKRLSDDLLAMRTEHASQERKTGAPKWCIS